MANTLRFKRGLVSGIPTAALGEPLFTTDTFDLYIGNGTGNTRFQKYIASGTTSQLLRGDGSLLTMPIVLTSPSNGQVLKYDGTNWVNSADAGVTGSGTAGQVTYWGSSSTITGNNNLFWDNTNVRLGIGTNAPAYLLDVLTNQNAGTIASISNSTSGTGAFTGFRIGSSANVWLYNFSTGYTTSGRFVAGTFLIDSATSNGININNTNAAPIAFGISNTEGMRLDASRNLLIGNTNGTARLDVQTTAQFIANLASSNVSGGYITLGRTGASSIIGAYSSASGGGTQINADALFFRTTTGIGFSGSGAATKMWLTPADNLVIGSTTDAGYRLDVNGTAQIRSNLFLGVDSSSNARIYLFNASNTSRGEIYFDGNNSFRIESTYGGTGTYRPMTFWTNATERMRLDTSGNLGLGVTPSAWTSVQRVFEITYAGNAIYSGSGNNNLQISSNAYFSSGWKYGGNGFGNRLNIGSSDGSFQFYTAPNNTSGAGAALTFTQAMTLDASGRLGIGTTSPSARLEVSGGRTYLGSSDGYELAFTRTGNYFYIYNDGGGLSGKLTFTTSTGITEPILTLTQNTRNVIVGGTSDAGFKLDVNGTMRVSGNATIGGDVYLSAANKAIIFNSSANLNTQVWEFSGSLRFMTGGATQLTIASTGAATFSSSVTGASFIPTSSTIPTNGMYLSAANTLAFATASGNKLTISSTGLATFTDSARFSNLKGCIFVQTGGSLLGSISMDSSNQVTIDNNGFFGLSVGSNYTMTGGNLGIGHSSFGTSATRTISVVNGTAPSTSPTDAFQMYSNDVVAGNAAPHFRTENGAVIKLYQETTAVGNAIVGAGGGSAMLDDDTFDGYTLRQVVRALRNQGILQ